MSMNSPAHPHPERLAALAGDDPEARSDRDLVAHVAACTACEGDVREMSILRAALAELPDVAPNRPLRLVPPVAAPALADGWRVTWQRAFAPLAVAGMVFLLVGSVGATGVLGPADAGAFLQRFSSAAQPAPAEAPELAATAPGTPVQSAAAMDASGEAGALAPSASTPSDGGTAAEGAGVNDLGASRGEDLGMTESRIPWIVLTVIGMGMLGLALVLRRTKVPADRT